MKIITKILLSTSFVLIPLGVLAQENFEEESDFSKHYLIEKKDVNYSFEGKLEKKPKNGFNGIWTIAGVRMLVDNKTFIKQSKKVIEIGDQIEVKAKRIDNNVRAVILEQEEDFFK